MKLKTLSCALLVAAAAFLVYWPSLGYPFQFDDSLLLRDYNVPNGRWMPFFWPPKPRVLTWLIFLIQYQFHGLNPIPYHAFSLLLHAANSVLAFFLLRLIFQHFPLPPRQEMASGVEAIIRKRPFFLFPALSGALIFALHPLQTESVLYIYQRSTLLATFFALLSLMAHLKRRTYLTFLLFSLALSAKEFVIGLPLVLWAADGFLRRQWKPSKQMWSCLAVSLIVLIFFLGWVRPSGETTVGGGIRESALYAATQIKVLWRYVGLAIVPHPLNLDRDIRPQEGLADAKWWLALILLAVLAWGTLRVRRQYGRAAFFIALYFLLLLPTSSVVPSLDFMFEHRVYASMLGFAGLISLVLGEGWNKAMTRPRLSKPVQQWLARGVVGGLMISLLAFYASTDLRRSRVWSDEVRLWQDTVAQSPGKYRPNYNLGVVLMDRSPQQAVGYLVKAIEINPSIPLAYRSLGQIYFKREEVETAERLWKQALVLEPQHAATHRELGKLYAAQLDYFRSSYHLKRAQELNPADWQAYYHLARLDLQFGFLEKAIAGCERGLNHQPSCTDLRFLLADAVAKTQNWKRAAELYREGLQKDPENSLAYYKLARVYWMMGEQLQAVQVAHQGMAVSSSNEGASGKRNRHRTPLRKIKILGRTGLKELRIFWKEARTK